MNFVRVHEKLTDDGSNLSVLPIKILQPLRETYDALLLQPLGTMQATDQHIRHADQNAAVELYQNLVNKAYDYSVDLFVTPEYCIPWSVIEKIAETDLKPKSGALWVLGCESTTLDALETFKARCTQKGIKVLYETPQQQNKDFLCPLVYLFWVNDENDGPNLCMLIQFKTVPSGGTVENDHLYLGSDVYIFGNGSNELNFFSLICADAFNITQEQLQKYHKDSLITHIQLNEKPWQPDFERYRNWLFSVGSNNYVELMCLNWATGITWNNDDDPDNITIWSNISNSAFYIPRLLVNKVRDKEIDVIHRNGIYYNRVHSHWDGFFLNKSAQAILVRKQPIRFDGEQVLALPWKLQCLKRFIPENMKNVWIEADCANDGFTELLTECRPADPKFQIEFERFEANLKAVHDASPLAVERCLELLQGPKGKPSTWYLREELQALEVASMESPRRVTTHQEKCLTREGVYFRRRRVKASYDAAILHTQHLDWPIPLKDIGEGFAYQWQPDHPHCNVVPLESDNPATLIYLDSCIPDEAKSNYVKMTKGLREHALKTGDVESIIRAKDRLCVVYQENHQYEILHEPDGKKSIITPANQSPTRIDAE